MSYRKYVETKNKPKMSFNLQSYRENLQANLAKFLFTPDETINEIKSHIIDIDEIFEQLSQLKYPKSEEYIIALCSLNSKRISCANSEFKEWSKNKNTDKYIFNKIQTEVYYYQTKLHAKQLTAQDIDRIVEHACKQSMQILQEMSNSIQTALQKISWKNYEIIIEAIYPKENIVVSEAKIKIGNSHFLYEKINHGFYVKENYNLNETFELLIDTLKSNQHNPIVTLYMQVPISERAYYEKIKRDLSLGICATLSTNIIPMDKPNLFENFDIWKIKVENKYIVENKLLKGDVPIKWIERIHE